MTKVWRTLRGVSLTQWILVSMIVGVTAGWLLPETAVQLRPLSMLFLRLIKLLIVPLIFSTLVVGIAGHNEDLKAVGRLAGKTLAYFLLTTCCALAIGLLCVNTIRPGEGVNLDKVTLDASQTEQFAKNKENLGKSLIYIVPESFFEAAASNSVLQVVVFAILFAVAASQTGPGPRKVMMDFCDSLAQIMLKFTGLVMAFAPFGIGAAIAVTVGESGIGVLRNLAWLIGTLFLALILFVSLVLIPVLLVARIPLGRFLRTVKEPFLIAFSTASSEAALPLAMQRLERFGAPKQIVAFVLPTGYSFNLDGSTLYLAIASIFAAQAGGIELSWNQQLLICATLLLTSKGVAAVPRASLVILWATMEQFSLPLAAISLIMGVDAIMDMARTSVNLLGNCTASVVMARWEGELDLESPEQPLDLDVTHLVGLEDEAVPGLVNGGNGDEAGNDDGADRPPADRDRAG